MVKTLATPPTQVKELVPGEDHYSGYCDAGVAGVRVRVGLVET
jgi:hypothetical protein